MLSEKIDSIINVLKWPAAALAAVLLPGAVVAFVVAVRSTIENPNVGWQLLLGAGVFIALYLLLFRRPAWGRFFSTFEHELTHAIFAWATLHPVVGFKATLRDGGEIRFKGKGNWLITVSPYFFPTWCVLLAPLLLFVPAEALPWLRALIGASLAYHVCSTIQETHRRQTDLKQLGLLFVMLFLPSANLIAYSLVLAFAIAGFTGCVDLLERVFDHTEGWLRAISG